MCMACRGDVSAEGAESGGEGARQAGKVAALTCAAFLNLQLSQPDVALQLAHQIVQVGSC